MFSGGMRIKLLQRQLTVFIHANADSVPCGILAPKWNFVTVRYRQLNSMSEVACTVDSADLKKVVPRKMPGTSSTTVYHGVGFGGDLSCVMLFAERLSDAEINRVKRYCLDVVLASSLQSRYTLHLQ
jgi:hypothetical protein